MERLVYRDLFIMATYDPFSARTILKTASEDVVIYSLDALEKRGLPIVRLPYSIRILLEALLRQCDGRTTTVEDVERLARWNGDGSEFGFLPARVVLQDFTGVPCIVDLAAMRDAVAAMGGDPSRINPQIPVDLVIDHSVQVDAYGSSDALAKNTKKEFERNGERYQFLKWGQRAFKNLRIVPPATGIVHQVNLEHLATVVATRRDGEETLAFPDSVVGTDSHTTMINGLGVLGWGVGGIEAEAAMLGQPIAMSAPKVVGVRLTGALNEGVTATDLVLSVTQTLRKHGVVEKFVEFFGDGVAALSLADRATIANMAPEYGATVGFFPVDEETLRYLRQTGREEQQIDLVERYTKAQRMFRTNDSPTPEYSEMVEIDLSSIVPCVAGPKRPQDRVPLTQVKENFTAGLSGVQKSVMLPNGDALRDGSVVIAAITSCTNTSNPSVMLAAGLVAKKAVERGLTVPGFVKTSLAPGSRAVGKYLEKSGLLAPLEALGFNIVGYGCTTCIGNSGPIDAKIAAAVNESGLTVAAVLSGNRNFEGRVHPVTKANYLASPPLVIAYALAGRMDIDLTSESLGIDKNGERVFLKDLWPSSKEIADAMLGALTPELFRTEYADVLKGSAEWRAVTVPNGDRYSWDENSTYIRNAPFLRGFANSFGAPQDIINARALAWVGDSVTTDHISPAGNISSQGAAAKYLREHGVDAADFNSFGARRGNHEVMMRGTFSNPRLKNLLAPESDGGTTRHLPSNETMLIYDAAKRYQKDEVPLVVIAGKDYGMGSSRDWAAKGVKLLGVRAVLFESVERIHRSNLIGMGILPLQFLPGALPNDFGLTGEETFDIRGLATIRAGAEIEVAATSTSGQTKTFTMKCRLDTPVEVDYWRGDGILPYVLRAMSRDRQPA